MGGLSEQVALKVIDMPTSIHDPCYQARSQDAAPHNAKQLPPLQDLGSCVARL